MDFFLFATAFRPAVGPTQPHFQCVLETHRRLAVTHFNLVPGKNVHSFSFTPPLYLRLYVAATLYWVLVHAMAQAVNHRPLAE